MRRRFTRASICCLRPDYTPHHKHMRVSRTSNRAEGYAETYHQILRDWGREKMKPETRTNRRSRRNQSFRSAWRFKILNNAEARGRQSSFREARNAASHRGRRDHDSNVRHRPRACIHASHTWHCRLISRAPLTVVCLSLQLPAACNKQGAKRLNSNSWQNVNAR